MHYKLCVMGNPIKQSKSPWIHQQFAHQFGLSVSYIKVKPEMDSFSLAVNRFQKEGGNGLNVTLPFKQEAYKMVNRKSERAETAKAVNTIVCTEGILFGDNTDGIGLLNDIVLNHRYPLKNKTILVIGAGGAVRGILQPLLSQAPTQIIIANRTVDNALQLAAEFKRFGAVSGCGFGDLHNLRVDVIIDGTGFNSHWPFPDTLSFAENSLCYDLKYNNLPTPFMVWAKEKGGCIIVDGLGMLVEQAAEAFYFWTGKKPKTQAVIERAKKHFVYPHSCSNMDTKLFSQE